jgi:hypothetical protein
MPVDWDAAVLRPCHDQAFGEAATFTPVDGQPMTITGVFFNGFTRNVVLLDGSVDVTTVKPVLAVREAQFGARRPQQGDMIGIVNNGRTYYIKDVQPDGVGELRLELQKAGTP